MGRSEAESAHLRRRDFASTLSLLKKGAVRHAARAVGAVDIAPATRPDAPRHQPCGKGHRLTKLARKTGSSSVIPTVGERFAISYSIVVSRHGQDINPLGYSRDVLIRLQVTTNQDDLRPLLP